MGGLLERRALLVPTAGYKDLILAHANLQSYWRMGEASSTFADQKGVASGTLSGTTNTRAVTGLIVNDADKAFQNNTFGAEGISFGNVYGFSGTAAFSFECWFKYGGTLQVRDFVWKTTQTGAGGGWSMGSSGGSSAFSFTRWNAGGAATIADSVGAAINTLYYLVVTYDGTSMRLYKNASLRAGPTANGSIAANTNPLRLFANIETGSNSIAGTIDEVAIYNAALDQTTITAHYNKGLGS